MLFCNSRGNSFVSAFEMAALISIIYGIMLQRMGTISLGLGCCSRYCADIAWDVTKAMRKKNGLCLNVITVFFIVVLTQFRRFSSVGCRVMSIVSIRGWPQTTPLFAMV